MQISLLYIRKMYKSLTWSWDTPYIDIKLSEHNTWIQVKSNLDYKQKNKEKIHAE
jgi:hypothetical protein